jgi:hypothetical protein
MVGGVYYFLHGSGGEQVAVDPHDAFDRLCGQAEKALAVSQSMNYSLSRNPNSFSCLYTSSAECAGKGGSFLFYESADSGAQPLSQLVTDAGLTADGLGCRGFPSPACPLRVESSWKPVCSSNRCEQTKSIQVKLNVVYDDGSKEVGPLSWNKEALFSPSLQLSAAVTCERGGGVWTNVECLTPEQAAQRNIASTRGSPPAAEASESSPAPGAEATAAATEAEQFICPQQIAVQGVYYPVDFLTAGRSRVKVPAMNGCNTEDTFVFSCNRKEPAQFEGEGQWVQVEAIMAGPDCQSGAALGGNEDYSRR